jgi:sarcosine oxidase
VGLYQSGGGVIDPELSVVGHPWCAKARGAKVISNCRVTAYEEHANGVHVKTASEVFDADYLVIAAGPWVADMVDSLRPQLVAERQVMGWFRCAGSESDANYLPPANII